jgi:hypothetical protein
MGSDAALLDVLGSVRWQLFCSLSFYTNGRPHYVPPVGKQISAAFGWMRTFCNWYHIHFRKQLLFALRQERGETGGRPHLHALVGGLPNGVVNSARSRVSMQAEWEKFGGGMSRVREFGFDESGDYLIKPETWNGADAYEGAKFGNQDCQVTISHSVWEQVAKRRGLVIKVAGERERDSVGKQDGLRRWSVSNPLRHPYDTTPYTARRV